MSLQSLSPALTAQKNYWETYFDTATIQRAKSLIREYTLPSTGVELHLDAYEQPDPAAPVFIFNHGGGGYSRLFVPLGLRMYDLGYTVLFPNQKGQGFSGGSRGDFVVGEFIQNIRDVADWARARYQGALILTGASVGSGLAYYAAAGGAPIDGLICHNLYQFSSPYDALALSHFAPLRHITPLMPLIGLQMRLIASPIRLPFGWLGKFNRIVDDRAGIDFYAKWKADPFPIKTISLRYLSYMSRTYPAIPLEQNRIPTLVINPTRDLMVSPDVTYRNYARLGGPKTYAAIDYGHWATGDAFIQEYTGLLDGWIQTLPALR